MTKSKTLSADVIELGAAHGATVHADLTWNDVIRRARLRVTCHTTLPAESMPELISELQRLVRVGGFPDQRVLFEGPNRFRIDAR
jgi:hypothetical protein